jgi:hypothetical protein
METATRSSFESGAEGKCLDCEMGCHLDGLTGLAGLAAREVGLEFVPPLTPSPSPSLNVIIAH